MPRQTINHSSSFKENGDFFCVVCKAPKDNSEDDCGCMYNNPKKHNEE